MPSNRPSSAYNTANKRPSAVLANETNTRRPDHVYHAFISYSHKGERDLARSIERTLWTFGRSWYQLRGIRTYRDENNLAAEPDLWPRIQQAVLESSCLVLLASPDSARSKWVPREVRTCADEHGLGGLCVVLTGGVLTWTDGIQPGEMLDRPDGALNSSVWELFAVSGTEPVVVDLRPFRSMPDQQRSRDPDYLSRIASIAAKALGKDKEVIWGEYYRAQRMRVAFLGAISLLLVGLCLALVIVYYANMQATQGEADQRQSAERSRNEAQRSRNEAQRSRNEAQLSQNQAQLSKNQAQLSQNEAQQAQILAKAKQIEADRQKAMASAAAEGERDQRVLASVAGTYRVLYLNPLQAIDEANRALEIKRTSEAEEALGAALRVAKYRRENRKEEAQLDSTGAGYLMGRWRAGGVFTKLRRDGRYALVASERGKEGPTPPGNVYLINLETLRTKELSPGKQGQGRRLEFMGFSTSGDEIFVTRQFYLDIYDITGELTRSVQLESNAKPTHLIAGMFGSYVLVGDTQGNLMLADTVSDERPQLRREFKDAPLLFESNERGTRAIVICESGRADLIVLDTPHSPSQHQIAKEGVIFGSFSQSPGSEHFLAATKQGRIDVWDFDSGKLKKLASFNHGKTPIGLAEFSKDEHRVVSLGDDGTFRLWDITTGNLIASGP
jgi:hypothetical protein